MSNIDGHQQTNSVQHRSRLSDANKASFGEGFINLQRYSSKHVTEKSQQIRRIECFDRSYDSKQGSESRKHPNRQSVLSSHLIHESIAEEPPSKPQAKVLEPKVSTK